MPIVNQERTSVHESNPPISRSQIDFYHANGYVVLDHLMPVHECDRIHTIFEKHADSNFSSIMNLDRQEPKIREILKYRPLVSALETIQQSELEGCMTFFLFKRVGTPYASQAWNPHQDNSYPQAKESAYITANIALSDQDPENGGMYIYPGSHRLGLLPFEPFTGHQETPGTNPGNCVKIPDAFKDKKTDVYLKKGSTLVLHGNVIHGSYPNRTQDRSRPFLLMTYIKKGESFISGQKAQRARIPLR